MSTAKRQKQEKASKVLQKSFQPRTENQADLIYSIAEKAVTIVTGPAGTGKSFITCAMAAQGLVSNKFENIIITRPMVQVGRVRDNLGSLPGELNEKFAPFVAPIMENLKYFFGKERLHHFNSTEQIQFIPLELCRGRSFEDSFIIVDESQNATSEQLDMIVTRIGKGSKMVLTGDLEQTDLFDDEAALEDFIHDVKHLKTVGICVLDVEDIQRHPVVADIIAARRSAKMN